MYCLIDFCFAKNPQMTHVKTAYNNYLKNNRRAVVEMLRPTFTVINVLRYRRHQVQNRAYLYCHLFTPKLTIRKLSNVLKGASYCRYFMKH